MLHGLAERTFDTGEVQLNYAEGPANGPPLVLLHGLGRRWQVFLPLIPALSLRWHIFAPDLRGHGKSSRVARGYHGPQYSEDIASLLRERVGAPGRALRTFPRRHAGHAGRFASSGTGARPDSRRQHDRCRTTSQSNVHGAVLGAARSGAARAAPSRRSPRASAKLRCHFRRQ